MLSGEWKENRSPGWTHRDFSLPRANILTFSVKLSVPMSVCNCVSVQGVCVHVHVRCAWVCAHVHGHVCARCHRYSSQSQVEVSAISSTAFLLSSNLRFLNLLLRVSQNTQTAFLRKCHLDKECWLWKLHKVAYQIKVITSCSVLRKKVMPELVWI